MLFPINLRGSPSRYARNIQDPIGVSPLYTYIYGIVSKNYTRTSSPLNQNLTSTMYPTSNKETKRELTGYE
jgi:hypothetical protein